MQKKKTEDNSSDISNDNSGTTGVNEIYKKMLDNKSETLNSSSDKYWKSRGFEKRPKNWKELIKESK